LPDWTEATSIMLRDFEKRRRKERESRRRKERERHKEMNLMDLMMRMNSTDDVKNLIEKTERIESHTETELRRLAEEVSKLREETKTKSSSSSFEEKSTKTIETIENATHTIQTLRNCLDRLAEKIETSTNLDVDEIQDDTIFKTTIEEISKLDSKNEKIIMQASQKLSNSKNTSIIEKIHDDTISRGKMILGTEVQGVLQVCSSIVKLCMQRGEFQRQCWCAIVSKLKSSNHEMKDEVHEANHVLEKTREEVSSKQKRIQDLETEIATAKQQVSELQSERNRFRSELDRERVEHSRAQIQTRNARTKLNATESTLASTRKILKESEEEFSKISKVNVKLVSAVDALKRMHQAEQVQHRVEMKEHLVVCEKLRKDIETLRESANRRERKHETTIREMRKRHRA